MTSPAPETIEREREKLYVTDAELIRRLGVPERLGRYMLQRLTEKHPAFPKKQQVWGERRYWPAVKQYFDKLNGMIPGDAARVAPESRKPHPVAAHHPPMRSPAEEHHARSRTPQD